MSQFLINESTENRLIDYYLSESFIPKADLVLKIKSYLDKNFAKQLMDDVEGGYPKKVCTVNMLSIDKQPLKTLQMSELLLLLDDKFNNMIKNKEDRRKFLKQVIKDWYQNNITHDGILTKNYL